MDDLAQGLKLLFIAAIVIMVGLGALTIVWAGLFDALFPRFVH